MSQPSPIGNPVAFNPQTMTVSQLLDCAETLRTLYTLIERGADDLHIVGYVEQSRDNMLKRWGALR